PYQCQASALCFYYLFVNLLSMALRPLIVGWIADRSNLISALNVPIACQLFGAAFFVLVVQSIRRNGLRHPALARHWHEEACPVWPQAITVVAEGSNV